MYVCVCVCVRERARMREMYSVKECSFAILLKSMDHGVCVCVTESFVRNIVVIAA